MTTATVDRTALSYWFPLIEAAGLPVPKTRIVPMPSQAAGEILAALDGDVSCSHLAQPFFDTLAMTAATNFGFPCFLRTDHTSAKHQWDRACYVPSPSDIPSHVYEIAEYSECADMFGLPWNVWAVRELLPTNPFGICRRFGNMPINREFRFFVDGGAVRCWHPYWPKDALEQGGAHAKLNYDGLCSMGAAEPELHSLASAAGRAVGGAWSVDLLDTRRGWFVTDMAEASRSWHWEGCSA